ncbi:MAG: hypothetical protein U0527_05380 [Candidatus Eisenbacteria bacterium]
MRATQAMICALLLAGLAACSNDGSTKPRSNQRPEVRITAGAADSSSASYRVTFEWRGSDADGVVTRYQYAIDDTAAAAWRDTTSTSAQKRFRADQPNAQDPETFTRWHSFYVRAIDDQGARSAPDSRVFNATNIAPSSRIISPSLDGANWFQACRALEVRWIGEDLDGSRLDHQPAYFEYKQVALPLPFQLEEQVIDSLISAPNLLGSAGSPEWVRVPTSTRSVLLSPIARGHFYAFAVRALDEGGALEPRLQLGRNAFALSGDLADSFGFLEVAESGFGRFRFPVNGDAWNLAVPTGRPLRFKFDFPCDGCGDNQPLFRYALDLADSSDSTAFDPNGIGGWTEWRPLAETAPPITFGLEDGDSDHVLWVAARCAFDPNVSRLGRVNLHVLAYTFEHFALLVDDARMGSNPSDDVHDAFLRDRLLLRAGEMGEVTEFTLFGVGAAENRTSEPRDLPLDVLARYQHVFWSEHLGQNTQMTGLYGVERNAHRLTDYLLAGGRLFIFGGQVAGTLTGGRAGSLAYPKTPPNDPSGNPPPDGFEADSFLWRYLHLRSPIVSVPSSGSTEDRQSSGIVAARSLDADFPDLLLDGSKWNADELIDCGEDSVHCHFIGGVTAWEGVKGIDGTVLAEDGLDSLYAAATYNRVWSSKIGAPREWQSPYDGAIIGQRYHSTRADTLHGIPQGPPSGSASSPGTSSRARSSRPGAPRSTGWSPDAECARSSSCSWSRPRCAWLFCRARESCTTTRGCTSWRRASSAPWCCTITCIARSTSTACRWFTASRSTPRSSRSGKRCWAIDLGSAPS